VPDTLLKELLASDWVAKLLGSLSGVMISMAMIAPEGTRSAIYRIVLGTIAGVIFAPTTMRIVPFFSGNGWDDWLAAGAATGFSVWFILEAFARWLSSPKTGRRLTKWLDRKMGTDEE